MYKVNSCEEYLQKLNEGFNENEIDLLDRDEMLYLGNCYYVGQNTTQDYTKAFKWYKKAAEKGNTEAMCGLGSCYSEGIGTKQDINKGFEWIQKAADLNNPIGMSMLGTYYENGEVVNKDLTIAIKWYKKAASLGEEWALNRLKELNIN